MKYNSQVQNNNCYKLDNDQYYTPKDVAKKCFDKFMSLYGNEVSCLYEPSAGEGVFVDLFKTTNLSYNAIDIEPKREDIEKEDFLKNTIDYVKGRAFVGNPPFGIKGNLMRAFYNQCVIGGDYIAFILPVSQLNNTASLFKFDLVYSEDLGSPIFSGCKPVHCCFNIYKRNKNGLNKKKKETLQDIKIIRNDSKYYAEFTDYDFRVIGFGGRSGKLLKENESDLSTTLKVKVLDRTKVDEVRKAIENMDLSKYRQQASVKHCTISNLINCIKDNVPNIK